MSKMLIIFIVLVYGLIYYIRAQQGGWEPNLDLFSAQRELLDSKIQSYLPSPQAELLSGILLGEKKELPPQFRLALRDTSTVHIVVVSGQNLTLLAGLFMCLVGLIKRRTAILISILAIIFYTLLTGGQVPVLRACLMAMLTFLSQILGREKEGIWALIITGALMLLVNPAWITSISFQLSFLATLGVIAVSPQISKLLTSLPEIIKVDLAVTISANLMVMPVIVQNFHQLSLVGVITNMLILWTIPIIMILGAILLVFSYILQPLALVVAFLVNGLLTYFVYIVEFFASTPFAWIYIGELDWLFWIGYYALLGGALMGINRKFQAQKKMN
jgi:competence protein ComEC